MARRPRVFAPGILYHVIARGNQRQKTFRDRRDYEAYLARAGKYRRKFDYSIHAYCLMPNHVHLLLESSERPLSKLMQGLQQSYSQYFNRRHGTVGHVFQGRYQAIICEKDEYLLELIRYIHLNPVRGGLVKRPEDYLFSGHRDYLDEKRTELIHPGKGLALFGGKAAYRRFVLDGIGEGHNDEYYEVEDQRFLGAEGFGEKMQERVESEPKPPKKRPMGAIVGRLSANLGVDVSSIKGPDRSWRVSRARTLVAYILTRRLAYALREAAEYLHRDPATLATLMARLSDRMQSDRRLRGDLERLAKIVES